MNEAELALHRQTYFNPLLEGVGIGQHMRTGACVADVRHERGAAAPDHRADGPQGRLTGLQKCLAA